MSQRSVTSYFNTRKRAVSEEVHNIKNRQLIESTQDYSANLSEIHNDDISALKSVAGTKSNFGRAIKRVRATDSSESIIKKKAKMEPSLKQEKMFKYAKKPQLSPRKEETTEPEPTLQTPGSSFISDTSITNVEQILKTPVKQIIKDTTLRRGGEIRSLVRKELNFDEVKTKVTRSEKLQELKASLNRIQELEKTRKAQEERNRRLREGTDRSHAVQKPPVVALKEFDTIELEVLTSPAKKFKTPTKLIPPPTPDKNELMSPKHTDVSKRLLFSPSKDGSPSKIIVPPAYQRFLHLAESSPTKAGTLQLPYKYRHLIEVFKGLDSVCAMFYNRKECITFKKLKPAVQRMLRKNFTESHLAQIKHLYPEAFIFTQMKTRNYGSTSKSDYFQLVILPNVEGVPPNYKMEKINEDNVLESAQSNAMNPQIMINRIQKFQGILLDKVKEEHDRFLKTLDPPLIIPKNKIARWHPEFDLENCSDIPLGHLPQPPNVEKYSSARDILSTARNLFNCATPMERAMERYEAAVEADRLHLKITNDTQSQHNSVKSDKILQETSGLPLVTAKNLSGTTFESVNVSTDPVVSSLLKGVPKSLLEKIRAKQAAKALDAITRRPSQDQEATKYSRLPELARHLRNVFITEKKGVLNLEIVIKKIQNSFRTALTPKDIENHLQILAKECPQWIAFHEVRKTMYLKISKDMDLSKVVEKLESVANEKSK